MARKNLKEGDEILIKIKNIDRTAAPITEKSVELERKRINARKNFYAMKERLEKEGII